MRKKLFLVTVIIATFLAATPAWPGLFTDGNFAGTPSPTSFQTLNAGSALGPWQVGIGSIDWIGNYWANPAGSNSIDMSGNNLGGIYQTFSTKAGQTYQVTFLMSGNPDGGTNPKLLEVMAGNSFLAGNTYQIYSFDATSTSKTSMGWTKEVFDFTASSTNTTLTFLSLQGTAYGPVIADVNVAAVPIPGTILLFGSGLIGLVGVRRRFKK